MNVLAFKFPPGFRKRAAHLAVFLTTTISLSAQSWSYWRTQSLLLSHYSPPQQWLDGGRILEPRSSTKTSITILENNAIREIPLVFDKTDWVQSVSWRDGVFFATTLGKRLEYIDKNDPSTKSPSILESLDGSSWSLHAHLVPNEGNVNTESAWFFQLSKNKFLSYYQYMPRSYKKQMSPCLVWEKTGKDTLTPVGCLEFDFEGPVFKKHRDDSKETPFDHLECAFKEAHPLLPLSEPIVTDKYITIASMGGGIFWVFDARTARPVRTINLYGLDRKSMLNCDHVLYAVRPLQDGTLLVAARSKENYLETKTVTREATKRVNEIAVNHPDRSQFDVFANYRTECQKALEKTRDLVWWEVDPETGSKLQVTPKGVPPTFAASDILLPFEFRILPNGWVKLPPSRTEVEQAREQRKKAREEAEKQAAKAKAPIPARTEPPPTSGQK